MAEAAGIDFIDISGIAWMKTRTKNIFYEDAATKIANIFMQLGHVGINAKQDEEIVYAPSSLPLPNRDKKTKEMMNMEEVMKIAQDFYQKFWKKLEQKSEKTLFQE